MWSVPTGCSGRYRRRVPDVALAVVVRSEIGELPVLAFTAYPELRPFSAADGDTNLLCGGCAFVLVAGTTAGPVPQLVIRCPACGSLNLPA